MKARIRSVALFGTRRRVAFAPGLNIISGPIASGKTTLLRLAQSLLGTSLSALPPEVKSAVQAVSGEIMLQEQSYSIFRPLVTTATAPVDVAGSDQALRLPESQPNRTGELTYGRWLLDQLELPRLEVPSAPSRPESDPSPVSIRDFLSCCTLSQREMGFSVFGHDDPFRNIKRRYVFELAYGLFTVETAQLQEELRDVDAGLREARGEVHTFDRFLGGTELANRAAIERELSELEREVAEIEQGHIAVANDERLDESIRGLQRRVLDVEREMVEEESKADIDRSSLKSIEELESQLEAQSSKITRAIVSEKYLGDIDFVVCPRCGTEVTQARGSEESCYLCLQPPQPKITRAALVGEQSRIEAQLVEARELREARLSEIKLRRSHIAFLRLALSGVQTDLEFKTRSFVSAEADRLAAFAAERASRVTRRAQLDEYLKLHRRVDAARRSESELSARREEILNALQISDARREEAERRVEVLEFNFNRILERFHPPDFGEARESSIDRRTFLPLFRGRRFDDLSSPGLGTLVSVAFALAHQETCIELNLRFPNILFLDGLGEHLGKEGLNRERFEAMYAYLREVSTRLGENLQLFVADSQLSADVREFVRIELSETDRLVPHDDLERSRS
jgi:hypothetical protein